MENINNYDIINQLKHNIYTLEWDLQNIKNSQIKTIKQQKLDTFRKLLQTLVDGRDNNEN